MYILIVGAGKVGYFLARRLCQGKHTVSVVDKDRQICEELAKELDALVVNGDACDPKILEEAGFLQARRDGTWVYYSLNDDSAKNFAAALAKMTGGFTAKSPLFQPDREQLQKAKRSGLCCGENSKICKNLETAGEN